jgi:glycosyltransferase involved in cell wall biosynthesis
MSGPSTQLDHQDLVMLGGPAWAVDDPGRLQRLAAHLAPRNRVLYVEQSRLPSTPVQVIAAIRSRSFGVRKVAGQLWVQSASALDVAIRKMGGHTRLVPAALRQLGFREPVIVIGNLAWLEQARRLPHTAIVGLLDPSSDTEDRLPGALGLDAVIYAGPFTAPIGETPPITVVPDGVDVGHLATGRDSDTPAPPDLLAVPRPIVGLVGPVTRQIDLELIDALVQRHPSWSFVIIGDLEVDVNVLRDRSNILIFGPRPYANTPGYLKGLSAAILPLRPACPMDTRSITTLQRYRAAGVPTVVSGLTPGLSYSGVSAASGITEFEAALETALGATHRGDELLSQSELSKLDWPSALATMESIIAGCASRSS